MEPELHRPPKRRVAPEIEAWRTDVLRQAGFEAPLARRLAANADVDLHDLLELVDRGCPPELAARILAPLAR